MWAWFLARKIEGNKVSCDEVLCFRRARSMYKYPGGKSIVRDPLAYLKFYDMKKEVRLDLNVVLCELHLSKHLRNWMGHIEFRMPNWFAVKFRNSLISEHGTAVNVPGWLQEAGLKIYPKGIKCKKCNRHSEPFTLSLEKADGKLYDEFLSVLLKPCKDDDGATVLVYSGALIRDPSFTYQDKNGREYDHPLPAFGDRKAHYEISQDGQTICTI